MHYKAIIGIFMIIAFSGRVVAQDLDIRWKQEQMISPFNLSALLKSGDAGKPLIISVGPSGLIKNAVYNGPVRDKEGADNLKKLLSKENKDREIIVYCGCCPYKNCPNIRPAFSILKDMKFVKFRLLDLPQNLKTDWIDKGYPMADTKQD